MLSSILKISLHSYKILMKTSIIALSLDHIRIDHICLKKGFEKMVI